MWCPTKPMPYLAVLWGSACGGQLLPAVRFTCWCCHETDKVIFWGSLGQQWQERLDILMCHMHCIPAQACLFLGWDLRCDLTEDHVHHGVLDLRISKSVLCHPSILWCFDMLRWCVVGELCHWWLFWLPHRKSEIVKCRGTARKERRRKGVSKRTWNTNVILP